MKTFLPRIAALVTEGFIVLCGFLAFVFMIVFGMGLLFYFFPISSDNDGCCCTVVVEPCRESHEVDNCSGCWEKKP